METSQSPGSESPNTAAYRRRAWLIVAVLFIEGILTYGAAVTGHGPFVAPLLKRYALTHEHVAFLFATLTIFIGICSVPTGWLLDRVAPQWVIAAGTAITIVGFLMAGMATTFDHLLYAYVVLGIGIAATSIVPISVVIANWFVEGRGLAMGIGIAGPTAGGMIMTFASASLLVNDGIAKTYFILAMLVTVIALPLTLLVIRPSPLRSAAPAEVHHHGLASVRAISGASVGEAVRMPAFWILLAAQGAVAISIGVVLVYTIPYMIGIGFTPESAAFWDGLHLGIASVGLVLAGVLADRIGAKLALALSLVGGAIGLVVLIGADKFHVLGMLFPFVWGVGIGPSGALFPLLAAELFGLKRYGSLQGLLTLFAYFCFGVGPVAVGKITDVLGGYRGGFEAVIALLIVCAFAMLMLRVPKQMPEEVVAASEELA